MVVLERTAMLSIKDSIRFVKTETGLKIYYFKCASTDCQNEIKGPLGRLKTLTGYCIGCLKRKRPYGVIYNRLVNNANLKGIPATLTYKDFISFTKVNTCFYCNSIVQWCEYSTNQGGASSYNLDRKDSSKGYSKINLVVCCKICNFSKNDLFTHDEFKVIGKAIEWVLKEREKSVRNPRTT